MKVSGENPLVTIASYIKDIANKERGETNSIEGEGSREKGGTISKADTVVLSPRAKQLHEARRILSALPDMETEKVNRLKEQMKDGTYTVDEKELAAKMIRESLLNEYE
ncbi:MAG: flagellar biosynthesis anti-sigma factor FlgM [Deltaproteobacteria bacterium]|nr:flagellar biosynthesis anti-sigma factor FlgM [Deltaproteobacteria bacterium]